MSSSPAKSTTQPMALRLSWVALCVVAVAGLIIGTVDRDDQTPAGRARDLGSRLACPECDGQSVADSDAAIAREIRVDIARAIDAGETDDQIEARLVARYDERVLLTPSSSGVTSLVWILPIVAAAVGVVGLAFAFLRWRDRPLTEVSDADRDLVAEALEGAER